MRRRQLFAEASRPAFAAAVEAIPPEPKFFEDMSDSDLKAAYRMVVGHKPHWKMKRETMLERINDVSH